MFGTLRFLLAVMVVYAHTWGDHEWLGAFAVFAFFVLSGYLMTLIVQEKYGTSLAGVSRFCFNRFLRIYPAYWFTLICTLLFMYATGTQFWTDRVLGSMGIPETASGWSASFLIFGQWGWMKSQPVPQAWALNIELIFYIATALFIGRRREYALACFVTSLLFTVFIASAHLPFELRYYSPISGLLPFALGAVIYFYGRQLQPSILLRIGFVGLAFAHVFAYQSFEREFVANFPLYLNVLLFGLAIWALSGATEHGTLAKFDTGLGHLSYPIYINHYLIIGAVLWFDADLQRHSAQTFAYVMPATMLFSALTWWLIERPISKVRTRVAANAATGSEIRYSS